MTASREPQIRIVRVPHGEAPEHVRAQWVGLVLPLVAGQSSPLAIETAGVLSGKLDEWPTIGYFVDVHDAVTALARKSPEAASWWRENAAYLFDNNDTFVFPEDVCEMLDCPNA